MPRSPIELTAKNPLEKYGHLASTPRNGRAIALTSTRFSVRALGAMALVTAERTFRNDEERSIEVTMTFPVPVHAALVGMCARIGDRTLVAQTKAKSQARNDYEGAIDSGKTAVLHEEALRGVHMISIGHVPPGKEVSVSGTWAMPLQLSATGATLSIPTTVGDVYGRSPLSDSDDLTHAPVRLEAEVEVSCDTGSAHVRGGRLTDGKVRVTLDRPVEIEVTGSPARVLRGLAADGRTVELTISPAPLGEDDLDGALLVDISGSMSEPATCCYEDRGRAPSKHEVAMLGLQAIATGLRAADRMEVWEFNGTARLVGSGEGAEGVGRAVSRVSSPTGGTELGTSIDRVLNSREGGDVLLVTDGKSHALEVHALARRGARFTVVLVGEDSLAANVGHLAALTGGQVFVSSGLDLPDVLRMAVASMRTPRLHQSKVDKGAPPESAGVLTGGMFAAARWLDAKALPAPSGAAAGQGTPAIVPAVDAELSRAVAAYAAWLAMPLMDEVDAAALAEAEGVVCHLTSMVLVDEAGELQEGIPAQRKVPLMTPASASLMRAAAPMAALSALNMSAQSAGHMASPMRNIAASASLRAFGGFDGSKGLRAQDPIGGPFRGGMMRIKLDEGAGSPSDRLSIAPLTSPVAPTPRLHSNLAAIKGRVDWQGDLEALRRGELHGHLRLDALIHLKAAAQLAEVIALASALGVTAEAVAVALLARAEGGADRGAARLARAVLGGADQAMVEAAARAVGL